MTEAAFFSKTSLLFCQSKRCPIQQYSNYQIFVSFILACWM